MMLAAPCHVEGNKIMSSWMKEHINARFLKALMFRDMNT
jgi:hypothetical protein